MHLNHDRGRDMDAGAPRRRDEAAPVAPAGVRLFKVVTCEGESIIGLTCGQLATLGTTPMSRHTPGDLLRRLDRIGYLAVWLYTVESLDGGRLVARPIRQSPLFARSTIRIEHFDPEVDLALLALAA